MTDLKVPVAVLGGGSFGTTLANLLAKNGVPVTLWLRNEEQAREMRERGENARYLPGRKLDPQLIISTDMAAALDAAELVFLAIPSSAFRSVLQQIGPGLAGTGGSSTTKGVEPPGRGMRTGVGE